MSIAPQPIDPELARSLSEKPERELMGILENPDDWRPEVVDFARSELGRRSVSTAQIDQKLAEEARQRAEQLGPEASEPLSFRASVLPVICGVVFGLLGLLLVWPQASHFKSEGYILKSKKSWSLYWTAFCVRLGVVVIAVIIGILTSLTSH